MPRLFRRLYSSRRNSDISRAALESSTPRAVRTRRNRFPESLSKAGKGSVLSDVEKTAYDRLKSLGRLPIRGRVPRELSEEEWLERTNAKRRRVRGAETTKTVGSEGTSLEVARVLGHRIYLPNIIFRLVRNHTPPGEPYNPFEATFRIPQSLTKLDIRGYLLSMYGVHTTYIRTDNRISDVTRKHGSFTKGRWDSLGTYKRAVVGLAEPFYFPQAREDMNMKERENRDKYLDSRFQLEHIRNMKRVYRLRLFKPIGYRGNQPGQTSRGQIIRKVMEQKLARENAIGTAVKDMLADADVARRLPTVPTTNS